jgi:outer membrane protein assembly factor BamB
MRRSERGALMAVGAALGALILLAGLGVPAGASGPGTADPGFMGSYPGAALSPSAQVRWKVQLTAVQNPKEHQAAVLLSSPVLSDSSAYVESMDNTGTVGDCTLYDVDVATHKLLWKVPVSLRYAAQPTTDGVRVYLGGTPGVEALNAKTGAVEWQYPGPAGAQFGPLVESGGVLLGSLGGTVYAWNPANGTVLWTHQLSDQYEGLNGPITVLGQSAYAADIGGTLYSLALSSGAVRWTQPPPTNAQWYALSAKPGLLLSQAQSNSSGTDLSGGEVDRTNPDSGASKWVAPVPLSQQDNVALSGNVLVAAGVNEGLWGVNVGDGSVAWQNKSIDLPSDLTAQGGDVYTILSPNRQTSELMVLNAKTGKQRFFLSYDGFNVPSSGFYPQMATPGNGAVYLTTSAGVMMKIS